MSTVLNNVFSYCPINSPYRTTSTYTVPSGVVALVNLSFYQTRVAGYGSGITPATITLNGVEVLRERAYGLDGNSTLSWSIPISGFVGEYVASAAFTTNSPAIYTGTTPLAGFNWTNARTGFPVTLYGPIYVNLQAGNTGKLTGHAIDHTKPENLEIWLKSGDVIAGTGFWQAIITEFKE